jgi:hypothetical protein
MFIFTILSYVNLYIELSIIQVLECMSRFCFDIFTVIFLNNMTIYSIYGNIFAIKKIYKKLI